MPKLLGAKGKPFPFGKKTNTDSVNKTREKNVNKHTEGSVQNIPCNDYRSKLVQFRRAKRFAL